MHALAPPLPRELQVEVTGSCNLRCTMCLVAYRPTLNRQEGSMSLATFRSLLDALPDLEKVTLQGLGEPLLAPHLFEMISEAAARGVRMGFNTNATLLTEARAERLVTAGLDWLHVSVDGATAATYESIRNGSDFERVAANVAGLVRVKRRLGADRPTVSLVFVAMRRNLGELPALVRLAAAWGVDRLRVQNLSHSFADTDPAGSYRGIRAFAEAEALWREPDAAAEALLAQARAVAAELGVDLRLPQLDAAPPPPATGAPGCTWPWDSSYVTHRGEVQPCCMVMGADRAVLGDVTTTPLGEVWHGAAYRQFREALLGEEPPAVCAGCSMYRGTF